MSIHLTWILPAALGALVIAAVVAWRVSARWRFRRRLRAERRRLAAFDRAARIRAGQKIAGLGLRRRNARVLLDHLAGEEDEKVRLAIAQAVDARAGDRSRRRRVRKLRAWADEELAANYQRTRPRLEPARGPRRISWRAPAAP